MLSAGIVDHLAFSTGLPSCRQVFGLHAARANHQRGDSGPGDPERAVMRAEALSAKLS